MSTVTVKAIASGHDVSLPPCVRVADMARAIETRAYELYLARQGEPGDAIADWVRAEREMIGHARANLFETENGYAIDFRLPGFQPRAIDIAVSAGQVGIHAHRGMTSEVGGDSHIVLQEFSEGEAFRQLFFPNPVDPSTAEAQLNDGVLHLTVKKAETRG